MQKSFIIGKFLKLIKTHDFISKPFALRYKKSLTMKRGMGNQKTEII